MVLQCVVDDSGSDSNSPRFVLGGFLAPVANWLAFTNEWRAELDKAPRLEYFKMSEAQNLSGEFHRRRGWTEEMRDKRVIDLAYIAKRHAVRKVSTTVKNADFEHLIASLPVPERSLASDRPYRLLFVHLVMNVLGLVKLEFPGEKCEFIFNSQTGEDIEIAKSWAGWKRSMAASPSRFDEIIAGLPQFKDEKEFLPLQAADFYAWEARKSILASDMAPSLILPSRRPLWVLRDVPQWSFGWDTHLESFREYLELERERIQIDHPDLPMVPKGTKRDRQKARWARRKSERAATTSSEGSE